MIKINEVKIIEVRKGMFGNGVEQDYFKNLPKVGKEFEDLEEIAKAIHNEVSKQTKEPVEIMIQNYDKFFLCVSHGDKLDEFRFEAFDYINQAKDYIFSLGITVYKKIYVDVDETN